MSDKSQTKTGSDLQGKLGTASNAALNLFFRQRDLWRRREEIDREIEDIDRQIEGLANQIHVLQAIESAPGDGMEDS